MRSAFTLGLTLLVTLPGCGSTPEASPDGATLDLARLPTDIARPAAEAATDGPPTEDAAPPLADLALPPADTAMVSLDIAVAPADSAGSPADTAMAPPDVAMAPGDLARPPSDLAMAPPDLARPPADLAAVPDAAARDLAAMCPGAVTTAGVACNYAYNAFNAAASVKANSTVTWSCSPNDRSLAANGLPDHDVGTFPNPNCPNTITAQAVASSMTLKPALTGMVTAAMVVGYAFNGVKFDPGTAGSCTVNGGVATCSLIGNNGPWAIEALGQKSFDFGVDGSNAHVQPNGAYHYHGMPNGFVTRLGKGQAMTLVGFAADGFPIYARYGYSQANNAASAIKSVTPSYRLKAAADPGRPATMTYPMGAFRQDYEYVAGLGDLDECNGRVGVTPEFPCGIYHYYITEAYPFIQRCVKGTAGGGQPADGGMGGGQDGGMPKTCTVNGDCVGACPNGSKGCTCTTGMMGMKICAPTCMITADCPPPPMGPPLTCRNGVCAP